MHKIQGKREKKRKKKPTPHLAFTAISDYKESPMVL